MSSPFDELYVHITPQEPGNLMERLDSAIKSAELAAMQLKKHGVLVTRHADFSFSVAVNSDVPYGMTRERRQC